MERVKVRAKSRTRVSDRRIEILRGRLGSLKISVQGSKIYSTALCPGHAEKAREEFEWSREGVGNVEE